MRLIMLSSSIKNHTIKLQQKKYRTDLNEFLVEGFKGVDDALNSDYAINYIIIDSRFRDSKADLIKKAEGRGAEIFFCNQPEAGKIKTTDTFPGVLAVVKIPIFSSDKFAKNTPVIVLDHINDPGNLGTIIRTADWFGIHDILLSEDSVDLYSPKVVRSTMGSIFHVNVVESTNIVQSLEQLKKKGYNIVALDIKGESLENYQSTPKTAYIFGSESHGIRNILLDLTDKKVTIKGKGKAESLNVAVSAGILMAQI